MVPRIPPLPYREVDRCLKAQGFAPVRQTGSHVVYHHLDGRRAVVPRHAYDLPPSLIGKILKQAGIDPSLPRR